MKKSVLLLGIIAWVAVLAAAVIIAGFVWRGDINMYNGAASLKEEDILLFGIENIRIETDSLDIELQATGEPRMKVLQYGDTNTAAEELFVVTQYEGGLKISAKRLFKFFSISITINERLVIQIPETWLGDISVSASSGNIRVHDVFVWRNAAFKNSSGDLRINRELFAESLSIDSGSGNIHVREPLTVAGKIRAAVSSGDIRMDAPLKAQSIFAKAVSGNIVLHETAVEQFDLRGASGDIRVAGLSGGGSIAVSSGNINVHLSEPVAATDIHSGSGDIRISVDASCSFNFTGRCSSGDIRANFPLEKNERGNRASAAVGSGEYVSINAEAASGNINIKR